MSNDFLSGFFTFLASTASTKERQVLDFKMECRGMLQTIVSRIHKKSPLTYTLVRNLNSLDPCEIIKNDEDKSCERFKRVLNVLHACSKVDIGKCDIILEEYRVFLDCNFFRFLD
jgi:hypothetical protein